MTQTTTLGARIGSALIGGLIGFCVGPLTQDVLVGIVWGRSGGLWSDELGGWLGSGIGLIVGAFLGVFLVGRSLVARWCRGTACAVGGIAFLIGFVGPTLWSDSAQGPLLGIFFTGPVGFVGGAVIGLCIGLAQERHHHA